MGDRRRAQVRDGVGALGLIASGLRLLLLLGGSDVLDGDSGALFTFVAVVIAAAGLAAFGGPLSRILGVAVIV